MRADVYLTERGFVRSRTLARKLIESGAVTIDGKKVSKAADEVSDAEHCVAVEQIDEMKYVSRGGLKLEAALNEFGVDVKGAIALDVGASTGGFTDCLLQNGARFVFAVDSGVGQLHPDILSDKRVASLEKTNARTLNSEQLLKNSNGAPSDFDGRVDLAVMDVSFISQTVIIPALSDIVKHGGKLVSLIKPQFEVGRAAVGKGGIVKDAKARQSAVENVKQAMELSGFYSVGIIDSPIVGGDGNREYIGCFVRGDKPDE